MVYMKDTFFRIVVDGESCQKLSNDLHTLESHEFIKKHKISVSDFRVVESLIEEYWINGQKNVLLIA